MIRVGTSVDTVNVALGSPAICVTDETGDCDAARVGTQ